jgi:phosphatidylglycerol:prolipoprotein diacylglycerol transferase
VTTIDIDPIAFSVGGLAIRWYGLMAALAVAVAFLLVRRAARRAGLSDALVADGALWVGIAAVIGGRALYLIQNELPELAVHPLHALAIWHGGLSFYGGLVGGFVALWLFTRRRGLAFGGIADLAAPAAAAGQAVGHLGCFIGGDSYGLPTALPWAITYTNQGAMAPLGVPLHPTQLYEAAALAVLAIALVSLRPRVERFGPGALAAAYLIGLAAIRFVLFFYRDDDVVAGGLKVAQVIGIAVAVVGLTWLVRMGLHRRNDDAERAERPIDEVAAVG